MSHISLHRFCRHKLVVQWRIKGINFARENFVLARFSVIRNVQIPPLLPLANEVWGKVMFSQAFVIPSVHRGCVSHHAMCIGFVSQHSMGRGCVSQNIMGVVDTPLADIPLGRHSLPWADTPSSGQTLPPLGRHPLPWADTLSSRGQTHPMEYYGYGQQASGTHPTGIHSCSYCFYIFWLLV